MNENIILRTWNQFSAKGKATMSFAEFRKEMNNLTDPIKMRQDLEGIELRKARERSAKINIDRVVKGSK